MNKTIAPLLSLLCLLLGALSLHAQDHSHHPYQQFGGDNVELLTLSQGQYPEFFDADSIEIIGSALLNTNSLKIVGLVEEDQLAAETLLNPEAVSRFLSVDPLSSSYPWYSPYQFAGNTPIQAIDIEGLEEHIIIYENYGKRNEEITVLRWDEFPDHLSPHGPLGNGVLEVIFTPGEEVEFQYRATLTERFMAFLTDIDNTTDLHLWGSSKQNLLLPTDEDKTPVRTFDFGEFSEIMGLIKEARKNKSDRELGGPMEYPGIELSGLMDNLKEAATYEPKENTVLNEKKEGNIEYWTSPDGNTKENRRNGDTTVFKRHGDGNFHIKEFKNKNSQKDDL